MHKEKSRAHGCLKRIGLVSTVVIGAINSDINLFVRRFPRKGEETVVNEIARVPGGKAGNTAVAAARILGPNQVAILGGLGKDSIATEHVRIFREEGVVVSGIKFTEHVESGQAYITIDQNGENMIHTYFGANATISTEDLNDPLRQRFIQDTRVATIMDPPFEVALKFAEDAQRLSKTVAWDPGVNSELGFKKVGALLKNVDYLVANESEIENLTGTKNLSRAAGRLIGAYEQLRVVMKLGSRGSVMYHEGERIALKAFDLKSHGWRAVNTVGCGDAFLGAFVAALSEGRSDKEALRWGNCSGGLKATRPETRGSPNRATLLKYLT